jgi:hypothetical protein
MSDSSQIDLYAQIHELVTARMLGQLTPDEFQQLEQLLRTRPDARRIYVRYVEETLGLQAMLGSPGEIRQSAAAVADNLPRPASRSSVLGFLGQVNKRVHRNLGDFRYNVALVWIFTALFAGTVAGVGALISSMVLNASRPGDQPGVANSPLPAPRSAAQVPRLLPALTPVARLTRVADCRWADPTGAVAEGEQLPAGKEVNLLAGLAEITFSRGARAIIEGPATFKLVSANGGYLRVGRVTALVPKQSVGFHIETPSSRLVDLGTEFGVEVDRSGGADAYVFVGKVQVEAGSTEPGAGSREQNSLSSPSGRGAGGEGKQGGGISKSPRPLGEGQSEGVILSANESARIEKPQGNAPPVITRSTADPKRFVRTMPAEPFPLFSTGVGLDVGQPDPHWAIVAISTKPNFKPQLCIVANPGSYLVRGLRESGQWLSNAAVSTAQADGCRWTFRTEFDLNGFDPHSASIAGQFAVDDFLIEVRLNGQPMKVSTRGNTSKMSPLKIDHGFVAGKNTLEIVIENARAQPGRAATNGMGLCVQLKGAARRADSTNKTD